MGKLYLITHEDPFIQALGDLAIHQMLKDLKRYDILAKIRMTRCSEITCDGEKCDELLEIIDRNDLIFDEKIEKLRELAAKKPYDIAIIELPDETWIIARE